MELYQLREKVVYHFSRQHCTRVREKDQSTYKHNGSMAIYNSCSCTHTLFVGSIKQKASSTMFGAANNDCTYCLDPTLRHMKVTIVTIS